MSARYVVHDEPHEDVAGYVLGALDPDDAVAFEAHLDQCAACRHEVDDLAKVRSLLDLAALDDHDPFLDLLRDLDGVAAGGSVAVASGERTVAPGQGSRVIDDVPAGVHDVIAAALRDGPPRSASAEGQRPVTSLAAARARRGARRPGTWLAAVAAALVLLAAGVLLANRDATPGTSVALSPVGEVTATGSARLVSKANGTEVVLDLRGLAPTSGTEHFECWWASAAGKVSAGSFTVGSSGEAKVRLTVAAAVQPGWKLNVNRVDAKGVSTNVLTAKSKTA